MAERSMLHGGPNMGAEGRTKQTLIEGAGSIVAGAVLASCLALPTAAVASDVFVCAELKAAVADAGNGFAAYRGALKAQTDPSPAFGKTYLAKQIMKGAKACSVVDVSLEEPKMRLQQAAYSCEFAGLSKLDKALRTQLTRCVSGEVDDPPDLDEFTIWVDRVSSGESYRATEVNVQANAVNGLTLLVRQSLCINKGDGPSCED